jgi:NADPH:quinone reductase-like Zn-dependent oxidoreductase
LLSIFDLTNQPAVRPFNQFLSFVFIGFVKNQTILVQGGGGVVAHFAIQFVKYGSAKVIATTGSSQRSSRLDLVRTTVVKKIASMPLESREKLAENLLSGRK